MKTILIGLYLLLQVFAILFKATNDNLNIDWIEIFVPSYLFAFIGLVYWIFHIVKINKSVLK